jgi:UDP-glucose 4-epimerase
MIDKNRTESYPQKNSYNLNDQDGQEKDSIATKIYKWDTRHGSKLLKGTAKSVFKLFEYLYALAYVPFIQKRIPALDPEQSDMTWIPINKNIEGSDGIALPEVIIDRLIELSNYRVIIDFCACRKVYSCKHYPEEIGCLFMGESARKISNKISRELTKEEAKAHLRKAVAAGLVPIVGEARADHDLLRIPSEGTLLTCCFCCECCCLSRFFKRGPAEVIHGIMEPLEGLSIEITEDCVGCGKCVKKCFIEALELKDGKAVMNEYCTLCGRCAGVCPENAIRLKLDNPNAADDVIKRILGRIDLS